MFFLKNNNKIFYLNKAKEFGQEQLFNFYEELSQKNIASIDIYFFL